MQLALREAPIELELPPTPLARVLESQGRRASWVARQLGVHRNTMSRWVNGREPIPAARITQIASLLGVAPADVATVADGVRGEEAVR